MANPETAEKMQVVVESLQANPGIVVVGGFERNHLATDQWPYPDGFWSRTLDIYTHPVNPIYEAEELNEFMLGLVPELEPTTKDMFRGGREDRALALGKLYYDEQIGTAVLSATVSLDEGLSAVRDGQLAKGWWSGKQLDLRQRTWVRVFPNAGHLLDAAQGLNEYQIPAHELGNRYEEGRVVAELFEPVIMGGVIDAEAAETDIRTLGP